MSSVCCRKFCLAFVFIGLSGLIFGCAKPELQSDSLSLGLNCVNDSAECMAKRRTALNQILADDSARWIDQPASANADASGVRLFAYKMKKKTLTCDQLQRGYTEAMGARARLREANNTQLTPALISRGAILGDEVARELKREMRNRKCKSKA
ncbi:MAG: hypothetical protein AAFR90_01830 [Pseudomonadota bacterium]